MKPIDPTVKALVSALGEAETGTSSPAAYQKRGASGEYGRYQFMPDTWNKYAGELGIPRKLEESTIEDQNRVAYHKIEQWKNQGYNPAQIASMWNAGEARPNAYRENWRGVNSQGVAYDTPAYAEKVSAAYQRLKGGSGFAVPAAPMTQQFEAAPVQPPSEAPVQNFVQDAGDTAGKVGEKIATAVGDTFEGKINPLSGLLRIGGGIATGITGLTDNVLSHTPVVKDIYKGFNDIVGGAVEGAMNTDIGQSAVQGYQGFAQNHPELAGDLAAGGDILAAVPAFKGAGFIKNTATQGLDRAIYGSAEKQVAQQMEDAARRTIKGNQALESKYGNSLDVLLKDKTLPEIIEDAQGVTRFKVAEAYKAQNKIINSLDNKLTKALEQAEATGNGGVISKQWLKDQVIKTLKEKKAGNPDIDSMIASVERDFNAYSTSFPGDNIKLSDVNKMKRQTAQKYDLPSFHNSAREITREVLMKAVEDGGLRHGIKNVGELNQAMGKRLDALKLLKHLSNKPAKARPGALKKFGKKHPVLKGVAKLSGQAAIAGLGISGVQKVLD